MDFMMKVDKKAVFQFSPLQSEFAKTQLNPEDIKDLKSVVVKLNGKTYRKAEGVLRALAELGGIWKASSVLRFLPQSLSNLGYDLVAENRYKMFGKRDSCRLPTTEERSRFIL